MADFLGYQHPTAPGASCGAVPNPQRFDPCFPNSPFLNQSYLTGANPFPLVSQPFGYPQAKNFVYAYSQQANLSIEKDLGSGFALSLAYNFNGGRHLNRPINANAARGDLLVTKLASGSQPIPSSHPPTGGLARVCVGSRISAASLVASIHSGPTLGFGRPDQLLPPLGTEPIACRRM